MAAAAHQHVVVFRDHVIGGTRQLPMRLPPQLIQKGRMRRYEISWLRRDRGIPNQCSRKIGPISVGNFHHRPSLIDRHPWFCRGVRRIRLVCGGFFCAAGSARCFTASRPLRISQARLKADSRTNSSRSRRETRSCDVVTVVNPCLRVASEVEGRAVSRLRLLYCIKSHHC